MFVTFRTALAAVALGFPLLALTPVPPQSESAEIEWIRDFAAARRLAAETSKPLLVLFRCEP
jgi:hypothetical protein